MTSPAAPDHPPDGEAGNLQPLALRAKEAARLLGIGERHLWTLTKAGRVPHVRVGSVLIYPLAQLRDWLDKKARASIRRARTPGELDDEHRKLP